MLAHLLSLTRVFFVVPLLYSLRRGDETMLTTVALLFLAALTDLADGVVARHLGQTSRLGKILDPLSDKVFLACLLGGLVLWHDFPIWLLAMLLCRDLAIVLVGIFLLRSRGLVIAANHWGKYTTASMGLALLSYVLGAPELLRFTLIAAATTLLLISSISYIRLLRQAISGIDAADIY
jgi:CDP-diacylglycerol--glycerol-3-phosphate 3-phosphatidyltransferase